MVYVWLMLGIAVCAIQAVRATPLLLSALWLAGASVLVAIVLFALGAREVAVIELSVGAGLVTVLLVYTIAIAGADAMEGRSSIPWLLALALVGISVFLLAQLGGIGLLAGTLTARAELGDDQISTLLAKADKLPPAALSLIAFGFLAAAATKSAEVPFHSWLPSAMEAPTPVSALIHAATIVNAGVYLLARFAPAFVGVPGWTTAVVAIGVLSALLGALMALVASDLKRVLAYSTMSQLGYMVYAVGAGAVFASQFHLLSHAVFKALLFLGAGAVIQAVGTRDMHRMAGLGQHMPFVRNVFVVGALALAGLPFLKSVVRSSRLRRRQSCWRSLR